MTTIEWTDETWNPTTGCDRVSPGCDNCYALTLAKRLKGMLNYRDQGTTYAATLARCAAYLPLTEDCGVDRDPT